MVKHIVIWDFKEEYSADEKVKYALEMKTSLEGLVGVVPGLLDLKIYYGDDLFGKSDGESVLYSTFECRKSLEGYYPHPAHDKAAAESVRPRTRNRRCADFEL
jgi:hypothetical protein